MSSYLRNLLILVLSDTESIMKEKLLSPTRSPSTLKQADLSNEMPEGNSALSSLFSAYASDSDNNEEQTGMKYHKNFFRFLTVYW